MNERYSNLERKAMSLIEAMKREADAQKERAATAKGNFQAVEWYTPKDGENRIRIMPHWKEPGEKMFFKKVVIHFGVEIPKDDGSGTVAIPVRCLREFGEDEVCPICDKYEAADKEKKKDLNAIRPQEKFLYNIFDINEKKIYAYAAPITVHQGFFEWVEDIGDDISDLDIGRDWKLIKTVTPGQSKITGTKYSVRPQLEGTKFPEKYRTLVKETKVGLTDDDIAKKVESASILDCLYNFDEVYQEKFVDSVYKTVGMVNPSSGTSPVSSSVKEKVTSSKDDYYADNTDDGFAEDKSEDDIPFSVGSSEDGEEAKSQEVESSPDAELTPEELGINIDDDDLNKELKELGLE